MQEVVEVSQALLTVPACAFLRFEVEGRFPYSRSDRLFFYLFSRLLISQFFFQLEHLLLFPLLHDFLFGEEVPIVLALGIFPALAGFDAEGSVASGGGF